MKEIMMYECDICKEVYRDKEEAISCEKRGKETPLVQEGETIQYAIHVDGGFPSYYVDMRVREIEEKGHYMMYYAGEYDEEKGRWVEDSLFSVGIARNEEFLRMCTVK